MTLLSSNIDKHTEIIANGINGFLFDLAEGALTEVVNRLDQFDLNQMPALGHQKLIPIFASASERFAARCGHSLNNCSLMKTAIPEKKTDINSLQHIVFAENSAPQARKNRDIGPTYFRFPFRKTAC